MSAIGTTGFGKALCIAAHADYCSSQFFFNRTQSNALKERAWESRLPPLQSWMGLARPWILTAGALSMAATVYLDHLY